MTIDPKTLEIIEKALKKGDCVELKKEKDKLVVVQIHRQKLNTEPLIKG